MAYYNQQLDRLSTLADKDIDEAEANAPASLAPYTCAGFMLLSRSKEVLVVFLFTQAYKQTDHMFSGIGMPWSD